MQYKEGAMVFLRVNPQKSNLNLATSKRLSSQFANSFKIIKKIVLSAFRLNYHHMLKFIMYFT